MMSRVVLAYGDWTRKITRKNEVTNSPPTACCGDPGLTKLMRALMVNFLAISTSSKYQNLTSYMVKRKPMRSRAASSPSNTPSHPSAGSTTLPSDSSSAAISSTLASSSPLLCGAGASSSSSGAASAASISASSSSSSSEKRRCPSPPSAMFRSSVSWLVSGPPSSEKSHSWLASNSSWLLDSLPSALSLSVRLRGTSRPEKEE
mmetsp:Transcript_59005/g.138888  ORF Transcript_59005/g.138888 Transcript_59005/m.138888 type:complete len:204 (+) Transcript_59005:1061-1672(+)